MLKVELVGHYGGDKTHAMSAWTSTSRDYEAKKHRMPQLLAMLAREGHHTPFEKSSIHFLLTTDIATHIHILKHRIGVSVNGESARYKELKEDKAYFPVDWKDNEVLLKWLENLKHVTDLTNQMYHDCIKETEPILGRSRAKDSARFFKLYNSMITIDVMFNFRSFMHFYSLRGKENAQLEVRMVADEMLRQLKQIDDFEISLNSFGL